MIHSTSLDTSALFLTIPTYKEFECARDCFDSFVHTTPVNTYNAAIIDDGSPNWAAVDWRTWSPYAHYRIRFSEPGGLTRSWNEGLRLARKLGAKYAICGNSDLLFTPGWYAPLIKALETVDLVGPVTNAPGHCPWQGIENFTQCAVTDAPTQLAQIAKELQSRYFTVHRTKRINGFLLMAKTDTWWNNAFSKEDVFNPAYPLTGNEDELQIRWLRRGLTIGFVPSSFIFHYRSVSRPEVLGRPESRGAYRRERQLV